MSNSNRIGCRILVLPLPNNNFEPSVVVWPFIREVLELLIHPVLWRKMLGAQLIEIGEEQLTKSNS
jgi:hypothetical protein